MNNLQVRKFFADKENANHSITDRLVAGGYRQKDGGYIKNAKRAGIKNPSQYWHLLSSWSANSKDDAPFGKSIQCGELIFWMAECSESVSKEKLNALCDQILSGDVTDRRYWNRVIQDVCFDSIVDKITKSAT